MHGCDMGVIVASHLRTHPATEPVVLDDEPHHKRRRVPCGILAPTVGVRWKAQPHTAGG